MPPAPLPLSEKSRRTSDSPISYFIQKALDTPGLISFAAGLVDEESLPVEEIAATAAELFGDGITARAALQYGSTQGLTRLREQVLDHVCSADGLIPAELKLGVEHVAITTGSQQLLYLLGEVLFDPGDIVITESPSYFVYHSLLQTHGVRVVGVPVDAEGLIVEELEGVLGRLERNGELPRVKLLYTVDYFQNPTGLSLSSGRRQRLVETVRRFSHRQRIVILEDAAYRELRFDGDDLASLKSLDEANEFVVYTGTFSKSLAPGLKAGYAIGPADLIEPMMHLKGSHDFGSPNLVQHLLAHLIASGAYARQIDKLRSVYRTKRDITLRSLEREFRNSAGVHWTQPAGGLYVWLTFDDLDTGPGGPLVAAGLESGVLYVPGEFAYVPDERGAVPRNQCRLCYGVARVEEIPEGIRRLRQAYDRATRYPRREPSRPLVSPR